MNVAVVDLETFWSSTHSLSKMSPIAYCMDPDTEIISCSFKFNRDPTVVVFGEQEVKDFCASVDWSTYLVVGHNLSGFDAMILAWRLGVKPLLWGCTLAMSRPLHAKDVGGSLAALVKHYGLGKKDNTVLLQTKGKHLKDFTAEELSDMETYNAMDTDQCYALFTRLIKHTSRDEMRLIDMTIRMLVEPVFQADKKLLSDTYEAEKVRKERLLHEVADKIRNLYTVDHVAAAKILGKKEDYSQIDDEGALKLLSSTARFANFLKYLGVDVPMKESPTGRTIPALAKTDKEFLALQEHENSMVAALAAARLEAKSTILQTRLKAFMEAADAHPLGKLPIPLKYYGADTTGRWSGWAYNPQNLPRIDPKNPKLSDALRRSLRAPEGFMVVVADLSGIELRVNHFLWKEPSSMELFNADPEKADLYKAFASELYSVPADEIVKNQRQVGKIAQLGLGFGAGAGTFRAVAKIMAGIDLTESEAQDIVCKWRAQYSRIARGWKTCHRSLATIMRGQTGDPIDPWGMITPVAEGLQTPKGIIRYPDLRQEYNPERNNQEYVYGHGRNKARIYAGKVDENIVQHLARHVIADNALAVRRQLGLTPALMVHDELVYVVPVDKAEATLDAVQEIMRTPPEWWPELVTWSEGDIAAAYGDAK